MKEVFVKVEDEEWPGIREMLEDAGVAFMALDEVGE